MIGNLRHKLTRLTPARTPDNGGGAEITWQPAGDLWASVEQLTPLRDRSGDRRVFLKRIAAEVRADNEIEAGHRLRYENKEFEIVSIETVDDRQRRHVLIGEEIPARVLLAGGVT